MNDHKRCPICGDWGWFGSRVMADHQCKPAWECRMEWAGDDDAWERVHAADAEDAAEKFAERYDCEGGDYAIVGSRCDKDPVVQVRKPPDEDTENPPFERWAIEAETVPQYYANKL